MCLLTILRQWKNFIYIGTRVSGKVGDRIVLVRNKRLMQAWNVIVGPKVENYKSENEQLVKICVLVAIDGKITGAFYYD